MLKSLYIKNYVLIDALDISFDSGFSVITGETGAGKSIILGALSLILGQRADTQAIKIGENKCIIEGVFDISVYNLSRYFEENNIEYDPYACIIRREISSNGKSRAFINDSPVSLSELKKISEKLIDIHSQHQNLLLSDEYFQLNLLDAYSQNRELVTQYKEAYHTYKKLFGELHHLKQVAEKTKEDEAYIRFQYDTLSAAMLVDGELELLEAEQDMLIHSGQIKTALYHVSENLSNEETGLLSCLKDSMSSLSSIVEFFPASENACERLHVAYVDLQDVVHDLDKYVEGVDYNPARAQEIESRLDLIYTLLQKYKVDSIKDLLDLREEFASRLDQIGSFDDDLNRLEKEVSLNKIELDGWANRLTEQRCFASQQISEELLAKMNLLGMASSQIEFRLEPKEPDLSGADQLDILFTANKNQPLQPVAKIASGGEMSRLMLCLKSIIARRMSLPTIIFDEIDTGVSGEIADKMGDIMLNLGNAMQVITITHLPQIAVKGKAHYKVSKKEIDGVVQTNLHRLTFDGRVQEIASMLSGSQITREAVQNAMTMLRMDSNVPS